MIVRSCAPCSHQKRPGQRWHLVVTPIGEQHEFCDSDCLEQWAREWRERAGQEARRVFPTREMLTGLPGRRPWGGAA